MTPAQIRRIKDPIARAKAAAGGIEVARAMVGEMSRIRAEAIAEAVGNTYGGQTAVAKELGVSIHAVRKQLAALKDSEK